MRAKPVAKSRPVRQSVRQSVQQTGYPKRKHIFKPSPKHLVIPPLKMPSHSASSRSTQSPTEEEMRSFGNKSDKDLRVNKQDLHDWRESF